MIGTSKSVWGFDPRSVPGCQLWLDGADPAGTGTLPANGSTLSTWVDKSGNARNLGVGSGTTSYSSNAIVLNSSYMFVNSPVNLTNVTVFIISKSTGVTNQTILGAKPNTDYVYNSVDGFGFYNDPPTGRIRFYGQGNDSMQSIFFTDTSTPKLYSFQSTGTTVSGWLNGTSQSGGTLTTTRTSTAQGFAIGAEWGGTSYVNIWVTASIYEILVYNTALTTSERQQVEGYLAHKWGLTTSVPSTHPFYSIRPHLRPFQPTDVPGCQLWLDAADQGSMTLSGSNVTQWNDKSGNGGNAVAGTAVYPIYNIKTLNNIPVIGLENGSDYFLVSNNFTVTDFPSITYFCVFSPTSTNTASFAGILSTDTPGAYGRSLMTTNQTIIIERYSSFTTTSYTLTPNTWYLVSLVFNGTSSIDLTVNGIFSTYAPTSLSFNNTSGFIIGSAPTDSYTRYNTNIDIAEVMVFGSALSTSQRQQVEGYLAHKWGLTPTYASNTPLTIPGCQLWLDGSDSTTITFTSGSNVNQWSDKSGNGRNATVYNGTPTYTVSSGMTFNGSSTLQVSYPASPAVETLFVIIKFNSVSSQSDIFAGTSTGQREFLMYSPYSPGTMYLGRYGSAPSGSINGGTVTTGTTYMLEYIFNGTGNTISFYQSGTVTSSGAPQFTYGAGGTITLIGSYGGGGFLQGQIYEILVYNTALTTSQRQQIEGYLARKWGISISATLPSPHPFKSFPPATAAHFSPTDITGCQLWLDAADSSAVTIATGVSQWNDKSGNSNNLTQSTTGSQPTYASSLVTFANDKYLNIPATVLNNLPTWSLFFVINPISSSNWIMSKQRDSVDSYNILSMTYNTNNFGQVQSGSVGNLYWRSMNAGTQLGSSDSLTTSTLQTCSLTYDGTILYFYKNGELNQATTGSFAIQNQTSPNTYTLGALIYSSGIANPGVTNFRLGEMITYSTFLTNAQRERVEGYLAHKWGLTSSLYSTHPYRTLPPIFPPIIQYNIIATGGTIVSTVGTTYHVFRTSSSFVVRRSVTVNYLVVGGGGGGGDRHGGGGGAGGVLSGNWSASAGTYIITVGAGGQYGSTNEGGQVAYGTPNGSGTKGGDSLLSGTGISITAYGGGGGGSYDGNPSGTVGSGGGGGGQNLSGVAGTAGQGNAGGAGLLPGAGGGGGAGGAGVAANTGTGGIGTSSFSTHLLAVGYGTTFAVPTSPNTVISGGVAYIAGGGGGCAGTSPGPGGSGGLGGGGRGDWADTNITAGTPNTGGGGGGTRSHPDSLQTTGRNGGSGLVLVWY